MLRTVFLSLALGLAASCAVAQIAPSPADVGISKGTPDVFKLKGHDNAWTPFGSVDPSTHIFIPGTNGNIAPNDCVKWGPGLTSAGAACNSVTGGATPANQLTIYTNHAGLVANVTTPTEAWTVQQQGFYAPGDGGAATYQWSLTSYCTGGTSGVPTAADGVACVLPIGQSATTAGRYLLQLGNGIDVRQIGMVGDGVTDNYPLVASLMSMINPANSSNSQSDVFFPARIGQTFTYYYFSKSFQVTRPMNIRCQGIAAGGGGASTGLIFPAGVHGVVFNNYSSSPDGSGTGAGSMSGCGVYSNGFHETFAVTTGSNPVVTLPVDKQFGTWNFHVGDGIIPYLFGPINGQAAVPPGTTVAAANSTTQQVTPSSPIVSSYTGNAFAVWRLPVEDAFTVQTTAGQPTVTITGGPDIIRPGDFVWSDAFPFGSVVLDATGTVGAQTVTFTNYSMTFNNTVNATVTHTSGSPGQMWIIPAAVKQYNETYLRNNYLSTFGIALEMECSQWSATLKAACGTSSSEGNRMIFNIIGRIVMGVDSGGATSSSNVYAYNSFADIVEAGGVGTTYWNENANSAEDSTALYGAVGECGFANQSTFIGGYVTTTGGYCLNNRLDTAPTSGGSIMWIAPIASAPYGAPTLYSGGFHNHWQFNADDPAGIQTCMNDPGAPLSWSRGSQGCGGGPLSWQVKFDGRGFWNWTYYGGAGQPMWMTEGTLGNYTGYTVSNHATMAFTTGFLLNDAESGSGPGPERLVDEGTSVPTGTFHKPGDIHFNQNAYYTGNLAWTNGYVDYGNVLLGAAVVSGTTTNVVVNVCPTPTPPVGTPFVDYTSGVGTGLPKFLGTFASCAASILYFQAAAANDAANGDALGFMQWLAAGPVANDTAGTQWTLGNYMTLKPVALASLPATCSPGTFAAINNGVASPTYNAAVGATTGAATDPVFCTNGNVWTYH